MLSNLFVVALFCFFWIEQTHSHAYMKYPPTRPMMVGAIEVSDVLAKHTPVKTLSTTNMGYAEGPFYKPFPCGSEKKSEITELTPGMTLDVVIAINNPHHGGHCQFAFSYNNGVSFVSIHYILYECILFDGNSAPPETTIPVNLPETLPEGEAIFSWSWIPKITKQAEFYHSCADVRINSKLKSGSIIGRPLIVPSLDSYTYLSFRAGEGYEYLFTTTQEVNMTISGGSVTVTPEMFAKTDGLFPDDPILETLRLNQPKEDDIPSSIHPKGRSPKEIETDWDKKASSSSAVPGAPIKYEVNDVDSLSRADFGDAPVELTTSPYSSSSSNSVYEEKGSKFSEAFQESEANTNDVNWGEPSTQQDASQVFQAFPNDAAQEFESAPEAAPSSDFSARSLEPSKPKKSKGHCLRKGTKFNKKKE